MCSWENSLLYAKAANIDDGRLRYMYVHMSDTTRCQAMKLFTPLDRHSTSHQLTTWWLIDAGSSTHDTVVATASDQRNTCAFNAFPMYCKQQNARWHWGLIVFSVWSGIVLASFPGPTRSSLAVQNLHRGRGLVHHVMCAAAYITAFHWESMMS